MQRSAAWRPDIRPVSGPPPEGTRLAAVAGGNGLAAVGRFAGAAFQARDRTYKSVDGLDLAVGQVLEVRPRHDLEQSPIERKRETVGRDGSRTARVPVIQVLSGPQDQLEIRQCVAFRAAGAVRSQIAVNYVRIWANAE